LNIATETYSIVHEFLPRLTLFFVEKQLHSFNGFSSPPKRSRVHSTDSAPSRKGRVSFSPKSGTKTSRDSVSVNAGTNTSLPGCPGDKCLYHPDNPRLWTVDLVGEYIAATDCKNYATYFMDQVCLMF
jgi:hypothetical protein